MRTQEQRSSTSSQCTEWWTTKLASVNLTGRQNEYDSPRQVSTAAAEEQREESDTSLEEVARKEQEYLRQRLRDELRREPSEEELNEYQRQHTEGY